MKIEIGESLVLSWLRHVKKCQIVQTNWKPSVNSWLLAHQDILRKIMAESEEYFKKTINCEIYKKNTSLEQLIQQAEIDVLGVSYQPKSQFIYAIDVAFHESGLNYGSKDETTARVIKKILRTAMCICGYFDSFEGEIIFASPKINKNVLEMLEPQLVSIENILQQNCLNFTVKLISNHIFNEEILKPVLSASSSIADTSELFLRSIQMFNMFTDKNSHVALSKGINHSIESSALASEHSSGITATNNNSEIKVGEFVRKTLMKMFQNNEVSKREIELMQTSDYSKDVFDIQYPLLLKMNHYSERKPDRYWSTPVEIYGSKYFICSEWYEKKNNNDRIFFEKWLVSRR